MDKKNILLVVIDCLRSDYVHNPDKVYTPTLNKWAKEGYFFRNTIASTSTTTPCFGSLLTGLYPFQNGLRSHTGYSLNENVKTFPEILKEKGYTTFAEVTGPLFKKTGLNKGFDEYNYIPPYKKNLTSEIKKIIDKLEKKDAPWFILLHIWPPHLIREFPPKRRIHKKRKNKKFSKTMYGQSVSSVDLSLKQLKNLTDKDTLLVITGDHGEQIANSRLEAIYKKSRELFFRYKKKLNLSKKHFSKSMRNSLIGHGFNIYDNLIKVPLILYNEETVPSGSSNSQIRQIDILPTILDLLDISYEGEVTGESFKKAIKDDVEINKDAFIEAVGIIIPTKKDWVSGIRTNNKYKYIFSPFRADFNEELYDLEKDPLEKNNIAEDNKEKITELKKKIDSVKIKKMTGKKINEGDEEIMKKKLKKLGYF